jgi:hypothetical protein
MQFIRTFITSFPKIHFRIRMNGSKIMIRKSHGSGEEKTMVYFSVFYSDSNDGLQKWACHLLLAMHIRYLQNSK